MLELIRQPWHWAVAGTLIGLTVPILLLVGNKKLGISASLRHACAICVPAKIPFFQYDWSKEIWNLVFVIGILLGGFVATQFFHHSGEIQVAAATKTVLAAYGITDYSQLMPTQIFNIHHIWSIKGAIFFILGGFLVGFGSRYAGGCTSGHAIMGLAALQMPSLIATTAFMIGGFISTNLLLPIIFKLF
jgi:uncharacterized membrane protein YedE/YeeE